MGWHEAIDAYCERTGPEFWSEPLNAVTNLAFILAFAYGLMLARRGDRLDAPMIVLLFLVAAIGIGSFLFHTIATRWAALADTLPIGLFILAYFGTAMRRFAGLPWWGAGLATAGFLGFSALLARALSAVAGDALHGSQGYVPALLALLAVGGWLAWRNHPGGRYLIAAGVIFAVSLTFRTLDQPLCPAYPIGTHFMWHLLNALLIGIVLIGMVRHGAAPADGGRPVYGKGRTAV